MNQKTYSYKEAIEASLIYFNGDDLAAKKWISKYCLKNEKDELLELTPDDMHRRISKELSRIEQSYPNPISEEEIYNLIKDFKYLIPQGSPMYGIGNNYVLTSVSNCFFIGSNNDSDSYGSILRTDEEIAHIYRRRGGCGIDLSHYRPSGALACGSKLGREAGATLYMERFSNTTREVSQSGRRGALIESLSIKHPDVEKFIDKKLDSTKVTGANISVKITDDFMEAVINNKDFHQCFPINLLDDKGSDILLHKTELNELVSVNGGYIKRISARKLWNKIVYNSWKSAEPGVLFWNTAQKESTSDMYKGHEIQGVNPCAEITLPDADSCRLLLMNLYSYVKNPFTENAKFDYELFFNHSKIAQKLMDDIVDIEIEKVEQIINKIKRDPESEDIKRVELNLWNRIKNKGQESRRTGLGITAEGDMLAAMGIKYGTEDSTNFCINIHKQLAKASYISSIEMAKDRGAFPIYDFAKEANNPFIKRIYKELTEEQQQELFLYGRRNIANLTVSPAGTTSLMTQTTSGIEPLFLPFYKRRAKTEDKTKITFVDEVGDGWEEFYVIHPKFKIWYDINFKEEKEIEQLTEVELQEAFEKSPYFGATANDINWVEKVKMQGGIQKWIDHSISVTTNLPSTATEEEISEIYIQAWKSGCKGQTVYRDGCRSGVLISSKETVNDKFEYIDAVKRPKELDCDIYHKTVIKQEWIILVGLLNNKPYEIFVIPEIDNHIFPNKIEKGKIIKVKSKHYQLSGVLCDKTYYVENIVNLMDDTEQRQTRDYSTMLRHCINPSYIIDQIQSYASISSFQKAIERVLRNYIKEPKTKGSCPDCGTELTYQDGCVKCMNCGYGKCG